jgi:D-lactate dehydrogenase (cytochrome)
MDSILGMRQDAQGRFFLRAQPGVTLAAIRKALLLKAADVSGWSAESREAFAGMKAGEWFFSPDPTEPTASIGGMASCNARGARSFLYGATRKHIHALRVTLADGRVAELTRGCEKARGRDFTIHTEDGGALSGRLPDFDTPLIKDAGYYIQPDMDLIDLFIGSQGALGIIAELELALMPAPKSLSGVTAFFPDDDAALRYVSAVKRFRPQPASIEFFNGDALALVEVNTDPDAPIFAYTDYGLAMDCGAFLREVL